MQLLTKELEKRFAEVGCQKDVIDPLVIARFFNPAGAAVWYATEYDPEKKVFFGYVSIFGDYDDEWDIFSISKLDECKHRFGVDIERDLDFRERPISAVIPEALGKYNNMCTVHEDCDGSCGA